MSSGVPRRRHVNESSPLPQENPSTAFSLANLSSYSNSLWNSAQAVISAHSSSPAHSEHSSLSLTPEQQQRQQEKVDTMPFEIPQRDRTSEFRTFAKSCQMKAHANGNMNGAKESRNKLVQDSLQFNQMAKRIGHDLSQTCAKMEKLAELAKSTSLFNDRMDDVEQLSRMIDRDIAGLNKQIAALKENSEMRRGGERQDQIRGHSKLVVVGLQSKLASVSTAYKNVLELRTQTLKQQKSRREKYSPSQSVPSSLPPSVGSANSFSLLVQDDAAASPSSHDHVAVNMEHIQQMALIDGAEAYAQARSSTMESIEGSIQQLGEIFRQLHI